MAYETIWLFMIVFIAFFPQQCFERPLPQGNSKRNVIPVEKIVSEGRNFTYECCGKNDAIFRWGLYEQGTVSPSRLFSRVEVTKAGTFYRVPWTPDFNSSVYSGRTFVEYNTTSQCVKWIITRITEKDENTFGASFRDNFSQGQGFKECTPVKLKVSKEPPPTAPKPTTSPKIPFTTPTPSHYTTTSKQSTEAITSESPTVTSKASLLWPLLLLLVVPALIGCWLVIRKPATRSEIDLKTNIDEENVNCSKDNPIVLTSGIPSQL